MLTPLAKQALGIVLACVLVASSTPARAQSCDYWVAPQPIGSDSNPGTSGRPWATLSHAAAALLSTGGDGCTVWFKDGQYVGTNDLHERFRKATTFRAQNPYRATLTFDGPVIEFSGAQNITLEGFEIRHSGPGAKPLLIYASGSETQWSEQIVLRDNIIHDSYNNDLLKIHNGVRFMTVEGNIFYNQGPGEEHIDVNGVDDIEIRGNIFFNDFAGSGRDGSGDAHSFITIKDSSGNPDGTPGSKRIGVRRNIFLNWQGRRDTFVQIGNDGKPYHEAVGVTLENNLLVGNSPVEVYAALGVRGARDVVFANNTVVGDLPSAGYAFWVATQELNPPNRNIAFYNNIWSDPTGTMGVDAGGGDGAFSQGDPSQTEGLALDNNLYWNGGAPIPPGDLLSPLVADGRRVVANPQLPVAQSALVLPRWDGTAFLSGSASARQEFERLVARYGAAPASGPVTGRADPAHAPANDILGRHRGAWPALGAFETNPALLKPQLYLPLVDN